VLQLHCKQPSIPGLHKRSQLLYLPRSGTRGTKSYQCRVCQKFHPRRNRHHFLRLSARNGSRKYISTSTAPIAWLTIISKTPAAVLISATSVERATSLSYIRTTDHPFHHAREPTILRFLPRVSSQRG